jgi:hypothetical protein
MLVCQRVCFLYVFHETDPHKQWDMVNRAEGVELPKKMFKFIGVTKWRIGVTFGNVTLTN